MQKLHFLLIYLLLTAFLAACRSGPAASFTKNGVEVTLNWVETAGGPELEASFAPTEENFHLYSIDMPESGIDGVGRPTQVEIISNNAAIRGPVTANQPVIETPFEGFSAPFPLYPDGPVTLSVPVSVESGAEGQPVELAITYIACSGAGICKPLVQDFPVVVNLPR